MCVWWGGGVRQVLLLDSRRPVERGREREGESKVHGEIFVFVLLAFHLQPNKRTLIRERVYVYDCHGILKLEECSALWLFGTTVTVF